MNRLTRRQAPSQKFLIKKLGHEHSTEMSCAEANCSAHAQGWFSVLDMGTDAGAKTAQWIRTASGRRFWEWQGANALDEALRRQNSGDLVATPELRAMLTSLGPGMTVFCFPPGQRCFKQHLDREVKFLHQTPIGVREHVRPRDWNESHNEEAYKINRMRERG